MDSDFVAHHLSVGLDMWFRDHDSGAGIYMTIQERKDVVASLTTFLTPHLVNNWKMISDGRPQSLTPTPTEIPQKHGD